MNSQLQGNLQREGTLGMTDVISCIASSMKQNKPRLLIFLFLSIEEISFFWNTTYTSWRNCGQQQHTTKWMKQQEKSNKLQTQWKKFRVCLKQNQLISSTLLLTLGTNCKCERIYAVAFFVGCRHYQYHAARQRIVVYYHTFLLGISFPSMQYKS